MKSPNVFIKGKSPFEAGMGDDNCLDRFIEHTLNDLAEYERQRVPARVVQCGEVNWNSIMTLISNSDRIFALLRTLSGSQFRLKNPPSKWGSWYYPNRNPN